jgi:hypothetical protein
MESQLSEAQVIRSHGSDWCIFSIISCWGST